VFVAELFVLSMFVEALNIYKYIKKKKTPPGPPRAAIYPIFR
jgi:hypothetical protein